MLRAVRKAACGAVLLVLFAGAGAWVKGTRAEGRRGAQARPTLPAGSPPPSAQSASPSQPASPQLGTIVLDPAHGGTDEGAHGSGGIVEKDVTLILAEAVRTRLQGDGWQVLLTRRADDTLAFAQRAALANAQTNAIFVTLHVGSSGAVGSACVYYYDFGQLAEGSPPVAGGLLNWGTAQRPWESYSRRLAQLVQGELGQRLPGSPGQAAGAPVYQLRAINEPAIAVELESVNAPDENALTALAAPLAGAIARGLLAFRAAYAAEVR